MIMVMFVYLLVSSLRIRRIANSQHKEIHHYKYCDCPNLDGRTELEQLRRLWASTGDVPLDEYEPDDEESWENKDLEQLAHIAFQSDLYGDIQNRSADKALNDYSFHVTEPEKAFSSDGFEVMKVFIHERFKGDDTKGGATLKIIMRGIHTRNSCAFRDYFNGTYLVCCTLRENVNTIDIYVMNVNFESFKLYYSLNYLVHSVEVDSNRPFVATNGELHEIDEFKSFHEAIMKHHAELDSELNHVIEEECSNDDGYWLRYVGRQSWRYVKNGAYTNHLYIKEIDQCFAERFDNSVIFIGDSHMRTSYLYVLHDLRHFRNQGDMTNEATHEFTMTAANQTYIRSTYEDSLHEHLLEILKNVTNHPRQFKKKTLLVINSGTWDLAFDNAVDYVIEFKSILEVLDNLMYSNKFTIVWIDIPPWPHELEHHYGRHINSYIAGAVNSWVTDKIRDLGIYSVPMWQYTLPFEDAWTEVCNIHYLCPVDDLESAGDQGKEVVQDMLRYACIYSQ